MPRPGFVSGQCSRSHSGRAVPHTRAHCGRPPAPGRVARRRAAAPRHLGVAHRGALRRAIPPLCLTWRPTAHRGADDGADHLDIAAPRPHPGMAVLALVGVFSPHITGGIVVALLVPAWWLRHCGILCDQGWLTC